MLSATGATVHLHYCMGELMSAGFIHKDEDKCSKCGMKKEARKKGCCKDEHKTIKAGDHHGAKVTFATAKAVTAYIPFTFALYQYPQPHRIHAREYANANAPPFCWRTCPLYLRIRNLRI